MMNLQSSISREIFLPRDEKLLVAIEVRKRRRRRLPFITTGRKRDYTTFLCLSVRNKRPVEVFITKVKQYPGSSHFTKRSQWSVEQLRRVDGNNPDKDTPEFDLSFDHGYDQWVASSSAEKCMFVQVLYHACQKYWEGRRGTENAVKAEEQKGPGALGEQPSVPPVTEKKKTQPTLRPTEFINCQSKLMGDACSVNMVIYRCKIFLNRMMNTMVSNQAQLQSSGQKASTAKGSTSKARTAKASTPKAPTTKASPPKASTSKRPAKAPRSLPSPPAERSMGSVVRRASQVLSDRGDLRMAKQLALTAQKLR